jgi:hypothetical protein
MIHEVGFCLVSGLLCQPASQPAGQPARQQASQWASQPASQWASQQADFSKNDPRKTQYLSNASIILPGLSTIFFCELS